MHICSFGGSRLRKITKTRKIEIFGFLANFGQKSVIFWDNHLFSKGGCPWGHFLSIYIIKHVYLTISGVQNSRNHEKSNWRFLWLFVTLVVLDPQNGQICNFLWFVLINLVDRVSLLLKLFNYLKNWPSYSQKTVEN